VGDPFPDFALPDSTGATFRLSEQRGRRVLLLFYRGDCVIAALDAGAA
jgi:peroxiredoxin